MPDRDQIPDAVRCTGNDYFTGLDAVEDGEYEM
jgi:hypothetical protein